MGKTGGDSGEGIDLTEGQVNDDVPGSKKKCSGKIKEG